MNSKNRYNIAIAFLIVAIMVEVVSYLKGNTNFMLIGAGLNWISIVLLLTIKKSSIARYKNR